MLSKNIQYVFQATGFNLTDYCENCDSSRSWKFKKYRQVNFDIRIFSKFLNVQWGSE